MAPALTVSILDKARFPCSDALLLGVFSVAYPSSEHFLSYNSTTGTPTSQMSPISNSEFSPYSAIEHYEETSSVYAEEGISRYPPQVTQVTF